MLRCRALRHRSVRTRSAYVLGYALACLLASPVAGQVEGCFGCPAEPLCGEEETGELTGECTVAFGGQQVPVKWYEVEYVGGELRLGMKVEVEGTFAALFDANCGFVKSGLCPPRPAGGEGDDTPCLVVPDLAPGTYRLAIHAAAAVAGAFSRPFTIRIGPPPTPGAACEPTPACPVAVEPGELDFGEITLGMDDRRCFQITNTSDETIELEIGLAEEEFNLGFEYQGDRNITLGPGDIRVFCVKYAPTEALRQTNFLVFRCADGTETRLKLQGTGVAPGVEISTSSLMFATDPEIEVTRTFTISNTGPGVLSVRTVKGITERCFSARIPESFTLRPGEMRMFTVTFCGDKPLATDIIEFETNDPDRPTQFVTLSGVRSTPPCWVRVRNPPEFLPTTGNTTLYPRVGGEGVNADDLTFTWRVVSGGAFVETRADGSAFLSCQGFDGEVTVRVTAAGGPCGTVTHDITLRCVSGLPTNSYLPTDMGGRLYDYRLVELIDQHFEDGSKGDGRVDSNILVISLACFGGGLIDDFNETARDSTQRSLLDRITFSNATVISGTDALRLSWDNGYENDATNALEVGTTAGAIHEAGIMGKNAKESPSHTGDLSRVVGGATSTHVLVWAGNPNRDRYRERILQVVDEFEGRDNTTVTILAGDGTPEQGTEYVDGPATRAAFEDAIRDIGALMDDGEDEQFIFYITDHGGVIYGSPGPALASGPTSGRKGIAEPSEKTEVTIPMDASVLDLLARDRENRPVLTCVTRQSFTEEEIDPALLAVSLNGVSLGTFAGARVELDVRHPDGVVRDSYSFEMEDESAFVFGGEDQRVEIANANVGKDVLFELVSISSGAIEQGEEGVDEPPRFLRGDANDDGGLDIADALAVLGFLFTGGEGVACLDAADVNDTGTVDVSDAVSILLLLFGGDNEPPGAPACRVDATEDALDCGEFASCG